MIKAKRIISILLTVLLAAGALTVFASAQGEVLKWDEFGDGYTVYSGGEIKEGKNTFTESGRYAYRFTAQKEGVYSFSVSFKTSLISFPSAVATTTMSEGMESNKITGISDGAAEKNKDNKIYYFAEGETKYFGVLITGNFKSYTVNVEYLGKVTDFRFAETAPQQIGYDILIDEPENGCYEYSFKGDMAIKTELGKTLTVNNAAAFCENGNPSSGNTALTLTLMGLTKTITVSVINLSDYIVGINTLPGFIKPTLYTDDEEGHFFSRFSTDSDASTIELVLKNGAKAKCDGKFLGDVTATLPGGKVVHIDTGLIQGEDGKIYLALNLEDKDIIISEIDEIKLITHEEITANPLQLIIMKLFDGVNRLVHIVLVRLLGMIG